MTKRIFSIILFTSAVIWGARNPVVNPKENELFELKSRLSLLRDSLHREIAERWRERQKAVERREVDKEELNRIAERQEKLYNAVIGAREEGYALERQLEADRKTLDDKKQEWQYLQSVINELLEKESEHINGVFPLDSDSARIRCESVKRNFSRNNNIGGTIAEISDYVRWSIRNGILLTMEKTTLLPDNEGARLMTVARFGTVFGYGMGDDGSVYAIVQSGREGVDRYRIRKIVNPLLQQQITGSFGTWMNIKRPSGRIPIDIVQSDFSGMLISGNRESVLSRAEKFIRAGGPVMIPLGLLPVWALALIIIKIVQFAGRRRRIRKFFKQIVTLIENNRLDSVRSLVVNRKACEARTVYACLNSTCRSAAERSVTEVLEAESSWLGSHLNTLAVIAGVAPLLGLLGTVTGMIRLFEVITRFGTGDPKLLAGGISEALITTEVGLMVAIPVLLIHNFLRNYKNGVTAELQIGALRIINRMFPEC